MLLNLSFAKFSIFFRVIKGFELPMFSGSAFRGIFGRALQLVAFKMSPKCQSCFIVQDCQKKYLLDYIFNPSSDHPLLVNVDNHGRKDQLAKPYILDPPEAGLYLPDNLVKLDFIMVGHSVQYFPFVACAFSMIHKFNYWSSDHSDQQGKVRLENIVDGFAENEGDMVVFDGRLDRIVGPAQIYDFDLVKNHVEMLYDYPSNDTMLQIRFLSPFRYKQDNKLGVPLDFKIFMARILDRIEQLSVHSPLTEPINKHAILDAAAQVKTEKSSLQWHDWERYSSRQNSRMKFGGYLGDIAFSGNLIPFLPYIKMGEFLHVGKQTTFGLGKYSVMVSQT